MLQGSTSISRHHLPSITPALAAILHPKYSQLTKNPPSSPAQTRPADSSLQHPAAKVLQRPTEEQDPARPREEAADGAALPEPAAPGRRAHADDRD